MPRSSSSQRAATQAAPLPPTVRTRSGSQQLATRSPTTPVPLGTSTTWLATTAYALAHYQPLDATLTALAGLETSTDTVPYFTGVDTAALTPLTAFGRSLIDDADADAGRDTLELTELLYTLLAALSVFDALGLLELPITLLPQCEELA